MKTKLFAIAVFTLLLGNLGCDKDEPSKEEHLKSIEQQINDARPIQHISIGGTFVQDLYNPANFTDAYAKDGFLIVIYTNGSIKHFNLYQALEVSVQKGKVIIDYYQ